MPMGRSSPQNAAAVQMKERLETCCSLALPVAHVPRSAHEYQGREGGLTGPLDRKMPSGFISRTLLAG